MDAPATSERILRRRISAWIVVVIVGLVVAGLTAFPFIAYGTDWLAYAHLMIAVLFIGPLRDPIRNVWVIQFGLIACVAIIPVALIAGPVHHIPMWWSAVDMSFGVFGIVPLLLALHYIRRLETISTDVSSAPIPAGAA